MRAGRIDGPEEIYAPWETRILNSRDAGCLLQPPLPRGRVSLQVYHPPARHGRRAAGRDPGRAVLQSTIQFKHIGAGEGGTRQCRVFLQHCQRELLTAEVASNILSAVSSTAWLAHRCRAAGATDSICYHFPREDAARAVIDQAHQNQSQPGDVTEGRARAWAIISARSGWKQRPGVM